MKKLINKIKESAEEVKKFNEGFDFPVSKGSVAADVWHNHITVEDRLVIMEQVGEVKNQLKRLRACYSFIEAAL